MTAAIDARRPSGLKKGFTLVEVVVALLIAALVTLGARELLQQLAGTADRVSLQASRADTDANAEHLIRAVARNVRIGTVDSPTVVGDARRARFRSVCHVPRGWLEPCDVSLVIAERAGTRGTAVLSIRHDSIPLPHAGDAIAIRYLMEPTHGGRWLSRWEGGLTPPLAIGLVFEHDTLVLRLGEGG